MTAFVAQLIFHRDLTFFLRSNKPSVERELNERTSVKDVIEACGVPHPEVDLILVNGDAVGFEYGVNSDVEIEVYGTAASYPHFGKKRLQLTTITRFVADGHLGKLTRNLRLLGFDVAYDPYAQDRQLLGVMVRENRALLTRDRRLLMHAIVQHGYCPRSQNANEQTIEVVRRFDLSKLIAPFTRCLRCNASLQQTTKADIIDKLEPLTKIYYDQFRRCPGCNRIYWSGSHFLKLRKRIEEIRSLAKGKA
jgi:uncharacterized protein with PIN domain